MRYREFCSVVQSKMEDLNVEDRAVSSFVRSAYESIPKGSTPEQQRAYAEVWVLGYKSGKLGANMCSREIFSGLGKLLTEKRA